MFDTRAEFRSRSGPPGERVKRKTSAYAAALLVALLLASTLAGPEVARGETPTPVPAPSIEDMMRLAQDDPAALMQLMSTQDPAMVGAALNAFVAQNPGQVASTFGALAAIDPGAIGGVLAAGPGADPALLAALGQHMAVDAWLPEEAPTEGEDAQAQGFWEDMGPGGLVERAFGKFTRPIPNARMTFTDIPTGALANLKALPEGFVVSSFFGLTTDGYLESDFVVGHVTFSLDKSWLQTNNIHQWTVHLVRFDEDANTWCPVQAKRLREDETKVYFSAAFPGFSKWVVGGYPGLPPARFKIEELAISPDAKTNQPMTIQVTVTNLGPEDAEVNLPLWINGQVQAAAREVLGPDERRPVVFTISPRNVGEAQVRVDRLVTTINVAEGPPPTPTPLPVVSDVDSSERGTGLTTGYIIGLVAAVVIGLTLIAGVTGAMRKDES